MSGLRGRPAIALVARREITQRLREKSFLISMAVTVVLVVLVAVVPPLLGFGGKETFTVGVADNASLAVANAADRGAKAFDADVKVRKVDSNADLADGKVDAVLSTRGLHAEEEPDQTLVGIIETARREVQQATALKRAGLSDREVQQALNPPALKVTTVEPVDPEADRKGTFAFIAVLALYAQLLTFGYLLASGVVEEKASRVVEVLLATIRPRDLLAGKIIGLGVLGFGQTLIIAAAGLAAATATGALEVDSDIVVAAALAVGWFVLGYAFYAGLFACAGALVPRQEELQSSMTPLTMIILFSFFASFAVLDNPDGTFARVTSFIPFSAPMIMPVRIALGEASTVEIVSAFVITAAAAAALIPIAGRIYSGAVLRTGSSVKLRDAWGAARARA
ncbi:MAG TPA: ABC transporter permease [Solirubrobacteraceae bacterium]|nr:ABC transporter permease [Solirubrobacteraceae bacterium]